MFLDSVRFPPPSPLSIPSDYQTLSFNLKCNKYTNETKLFKVLRVMWVHLIPDYFSHVTDIHITYLYKRTDDFIESFINLMDLTSKSVLVLFL